MRWRLDSNSLVCAGLLGPVRTIRLLIGGDAVSVRDTARRPHWIRLYRTYVISGNVLLLLASF
jgi:hypothetical protein